MKTFLKIALLALLTLAGVSESKAQGCVNYSRYTSQAFVTQTVQMSPNPGAGVYTLTQYATISGTSNMSACFVQGVGYAVHTPHITNNFGNQTSTTSGIGTCQSCYINFTNQLNANFTAGVVVEAPVRYTITCSVAGLWYDVTDDFQEEVAYTFGFNTGSIIGTGTVNNVPQYVYKAVPYCTAIAPDFKPYKYEAPQSTPYPSVKYFHAIGFCVRIKGTTPWICNNQVPGLPDFPAFGVSKAYGPLGLDPSPFCDYNP